jgi:SAM-dependent methyltransferase
LISLLERALRPGFASEIEFWDSYLASHPPGISDAALKAAAFPAALTSRLPDTRGVPRVLELGPGPVSLLAWGVEQCRFDLLAVDPLATQYARMLRRYGLAYPVRPVPGSGEWLRRVAADGSFDAAYSSNALDHARSPQECLRNLVRAMKRGGSIVLEGFCREGTNSGWEGLHRHDLVPDGGHLLHYDRRGRCTNLTAGLGVRCLSQTVVPFHERGIRSFGYEAEEDGVELEFVHFDWYTMQLEVA